jgi:hypothetical protein
MWKHLTDESRNILRTAWHVLSTRGNFQDFVSKSWNTWRCEYGAQINACCCVNKSMFLLINWINSRNLCCSVACRLNMVSFIASQSSNAIGGFCASKLMLHEAQGVKRLVQKSRSHLKKVDMVVRSCGCQIPRPDVVIYRRDPTPAICASLTRCSLKNVRGFFRLRFFQSKFPVATFVQIWTQGCT